jgi:thiamine-phosphate pyrophosphorylase
MTGFPSPAIYLVTDRRRLAASARTTRDELAALERYFDEVVAAAPDFVQVRESDLDAGVLTALVIRLVARARGSSVRVLVNDRADVALAAAADGVHVRSDGPPVGRLRALSPSWIVGRSIHVGEILAPLHDAAYLLFGPVFSTASKPGVPPAGVQALASAARDSTSPVLAIGGIDPPRAAECWRHGAGGVAGIGIFLPPGLAPDALGPARAVSELRAAMSTERAGTAEPSGRVTPPSNG